MQGGVALLFRSSLATLYPPVPVCLFQPRVGKRRCSPVG